MAGAGLITILGLLLIAFPIELAVCFVRGWRRWRAVPLVEKSHCRAGMGAFGLVGLVVTDVPKVPIWKVIDFNVLRRGMCGNSLISGKSQLFQLNTRSSATEGAWRSKFDL
jgi:hypothetical protein